MHPAIFDNLNINTLSLSDFSEIRQAVPERGLVCLKNQNLGIEELIGFTKKFGKPVILPQGLRFNNTIPGYPELARVSNIRPDGTKIKNHKAAEYWHVDGDFWQPGDNYIFNLLLSSIVPDQGGETAFIDMRKAWQSLSDATKENIHGLRFVSSCSAIPDFQNASSEEYLPDAHHSVKHVHIETGKPSLYINYPTTPMLGLSNRESQAILDQVFKEIDVPQNRYVHHWQEGDLLIWDNTSVMHKSLGGYGDSDRLLYRTQAFIRSH